MCHSSPTAQILSLLVSTLGCVFVAWHIWCFDHGRCLVYDRRNVFRSSIIMMLVLSMILFLVWNILLTWVKYHEFYVAIPITSTRVEIVPAPYLLWSASRQSLVRTAYQLLSVGWASLICVHAEETLYWSYLIRAIRTRNDQSWFRSVHFKIWCGFCLLAGGVMPGVANIETRDLLKMENNIFLAGSIFAVILLATSLWLVVVFPYFIKDLRRFGANTGVVSRLGYFKELNDVRTVFRGIYAVTLLALAIDGLTKHKLINTTPFWLDTIYVLGYFSIFISTAISLMILLPRSMTSEIGIPRVAQVFVHPPSHLQLPTASLHLDPSSNSNLPVFPYTPRSKPRTSRSPPHPSSFGPFSTTPWEVLSARLNLLDDMPDMFNTPNSRDGGDGGGWTDRSYDTEMSQVPTVRESRSFELEDNPSRSLCSTGMFRAENVAFSDSADQR